MLIVKWVGESDGDVVREIIQMILLRGNLKISFYQLIKYVPQKCQLFTKQMTIHTQNNILKSNSNNSIRILLISAFAFQLRPTRHWATGPVCSLQQTFTRVSRRRELEPGQSWPELAPARRMKCLALDPHKDMRHQHQPGAWDQVMVMQSCSAACSTAVIITRTPQ